MPAIGPPTFSDDMGIEACQNYLKLMRGALGQWNWRQSSESVKNEVASNLQKGTGKQAS